MLIKERGECAMKFFYCRNREVVVDEFSEKNVYSAEQFLGYVNSLVEDLEAVVSFKEKRTINDECKWIKSALHQISLQRMTMLVAVWNDQIVGAAAISLCQDRRDHVAELGISIVKGFRGCGLGAYLIDEIISLADEKLLPIPQQIRVSTFGNNIGGIRFYQKHGFQEVARIRNQFQIDGGFADEVILLHFMKTKLREE